MDMLTDRNRIHSQDFLRLRSYLFFGGQVQWSITKSWIHEVGTQSRPLVRCLHRICLQPPEHQQRQRGSFIMKTPNGSSCFSFKSIAHFPVRVPGHNRLGKFTFKTIWSNLWWRLEALQLLTAAPVNHDGRGKLIPWLSLLRNIYANNLVVQEKCNCAQWY